MKWLLNVSVWVSMAIVLGQLKPWTLDSIVDSIILLFDDINLKYSSFYDAVIEEMILFCEAIM